MLTWHLELWNDLKKWQLHGLTTKALHRQTNSFEEPALKEKDPTWVQVLPLSAPLFSLSLLFLLSSLAALFLSHSHSPSLSLSPLSCLLSAWRAQVKLPTGAMLNVLVDEQNRIVGRNEVEPGQDVF